jgi:hypothetical protein
MKAWTKVGIIAALVALLMVVGMAQAQNTATAPLCADVAGSSTPLVRANVSSGAVTLGSVFCQFIALNGSFLRASFEVPDPALLNLGVVHAVDIFGITLSGNFVNTAFNAPVQICLQGSGNLYYLNALQSPRRSELQTPVQDGGFLCVTIPAPGTLVLVSGTPAVSAPAADPNATPVPGATVAPPPLLTGLVAGEIRDLTASQCIGATTRIVRLRAEPNTTSAVITTLAYNRRLRITGATLGWYRVVYESGQYWVSADFFRPVQGCGGVSAAAPAATPTVGG